MSLAPLDLALFAGYCLLILIVGLWVSRSAKGHQRDAEDYFLAGKSLPWWAIGSSLIAANISAEQFIGMSGSGFAIGLAIASYEWMAAVTLIIVGKYFLPIFIRKEIYTIPEFVEKRFSTNLKTILAIFWIALFVLVNLTSVLYLGARAFDTIVGNGDGTLMMYSIIGLGLFAAAYSLWGGLSAVAWTDVVQVVLLVVGGLITTVLALQYVSPNGSVLDGFVHVYQTVPDKFSMILSPGEIITPDGRDAWWDLPGLSVLIGGLWVANLYYWGFNQYIIQRTLAAKSISESQKGIIFAGFLKLLIPLIVVIPGIIAYVMNADASGQLTAESVDPSFGTVDHIVNDNAAPWLIHKLVPTGLKGIVLAALTAAIVSSLASMLNSTATIFTMDIYRPYLNRSASDRQTVLVGRISVVIALVIAMLIAPALGNLGQAFQFIQEFTGVVSPGILAVFLTGLFWKRATNSAAIWGVIASIPIALYFKVGPKGWSDSPLFVNIPFMNQMFITAVLSILIIVVLSHIQGRGAADEKGIVLSKDLFRTPSAFNIGSIVILLLCAFLYAFFW
jgi:SSS family solute:Na+ symporter